MFLLIFSFATYVRDAGLAGLDPATPTILPKIDAFLKAWRTGRQRLGSAFLQRFSGRLHGRFGRAGRLATVAWLFIRWRAVVAGLPPRHQHAHQKRHHQRRQRRLAHHVANDIRPVPLRDGSWRPDFSPRVMPRSDASSATSLAAKRQPSRTRKLVAESPGRRERQLPQDGRRSRETRHLSGAVARLGEVVNPSSQKF